MRLNAYIARVGVTSRRKADELIKSGRVEVNGAVGNLNTRVGEKDKVKIDGLSVTPQAARYVLLNKPAGYVTTMKDEKNRPGVIDLISLKERVFPVGRLDYNTTGVLLLTNDGEMAHKLMHPSFEVDKVYEVEVEGSITPEILNKLSMGVELEDGISTAADVFQLDKNHIQIAIHEGRNRQVRRMIGAVGLKLKKLNRIKYGPLALTGLDLGQYRELTPSELERLKKITK